MADEETMPDTKKKTALEEAALAYHASGRPGKLEIRTTKPLGNQRDLSLAYSPGVAAASLAIAEDPASARTYTARGNMVAVVTNGTAVLGLGAIGPLASKPVMEGKAVLFKKFADLDSVDIEVNETDPARFVDIVAALEPSFGGINLEDIKGPDCFEIEEGLKARMAIPVFHDDQHGTAIIVAAAIRNALELAGKRLEAVRIVASGAGAAAIACLNLLVKMGAKLENIVVTDIDGVVHAGRAKGMDRWKAVYARKTEARTLGEVIGGADVFLGLSAGGVLKGEMLARMAADPIVLALANPTPEIDPDEARALRPDAIICTGRSDFPNQVNNVLCFPYLFRGALDVGATAINDEMKMAAVEAIAGLARERPTEEVARAYGGVARLFGRDYVIPAPFDPRLILRIAPAVARAAMESGAASRPVEDFPQYRDRLARFLFRSGSLMRPLFAEARTIARQRIVYAEGEDERVMRAAEIVLEDGIATPILIGRPSVIEARAKRAGLATVAAGGIEIINPQDDPRYRAYVDLYFSIVGRSGVPPESARTVVRTNTTVIAALALVRGEADGMLCGVETPFVRHVDDVRQVIGLREGASDLSAMSLLLANERTLFLVDTQISERPDARGVAETTLLAARQIRRLGIEPRVALLSSSRFGSRTHADALKMRRATELLWQLAPDLQVDGEMHGEDALSPEALARVMPEARLKAEANLLVFPSLDAANIATSLLKEVTGALHVGPFLLGARRPAHILTPQVTTRGILNMSTILAVEAATQGSERPAVAPVRAS